MRIIQLVACSTTFLAVWSLPQSHLTPLPPYEEDTVNVDTNGNKVQRNSNSNSNEDGSTSMTNPNTNPSANNNNNNPHLHTNTNAIDDSSKPAQTIPVAQSIPLLNYVLTAAAGGIVAHAGTRYWYTLDRSSSSASSPSLPQSPLSTPKGPPPLHTQEGRDFWKNWKPGDGGIDFPSRDDGDGNGHAKDTKAKTNPIDKISGIGIDDGGGGGGGGGGDVRRGIVVERHIHEMEFMGQERFMKCMTENWKLPDMEQPQSIIIPDTIWNPTVDICKGFERWKLASGKGIVVVISPKSTPKPKPRLKLKPKPKPKPNVKKVEPVKSLTDAKEAKELHDGHFNGQGHGYRYELQSNRRRTRTRTRNQKDGKEAGDENVQERSWFENGPWKSLSLNQEAMTDAARNIESNIRRVVAGGSSTMLKSSPRVKVTLPRVAPIIVP